MTSLNHVSTQSRMSAHILMHLLTCYPHKWFWMVSLAKLKKVSQVRNIFLHFWALANIFHTTAICLVLVLGSLFFFAFVMDDYKNLLKNSDAKNCQNNVYFVKLVCHMPAVTSTFHF